VSSAASGAVTGAALGAADAGTKMLGLNENDDAEKQTGK